MELLNELKRFHNLGEVMQWAFHQIDQKPTAELIEVVTQDEYTHDVVFKVSSSVWLVFDTT